MRELLAISDFGPGTPSTWLATRRESLGRFLTVALQCSKAQGTVDLTAEIPVTERLLDFPLGSQWHAAVTYLLAKQEGDGSWGTFDTPRENKKRHAVLTSVGALWAYLDRRKALKAQLLPHL